MATTVLKRKKKHTYEDYLLTPEGAMYQLIEGELVKEPSAPYIIHQRLLLKLLRALDEFVTKNHYGEVLFAPVDVYLDEHNCLQPDLLFVAEERLGIIEEPYVKGAPDLVVEILSNWSVQRDMVQKKALYEKFGVKEYWIVHPKDRLVEVYVLENGLFKLENVYTSADTLESKVLKGLNQDLNQVFV